ncbi:MAG: GntR family transcriptional regulator [Candidatus Accumulibacter sp.]|jgi:GntR family transcriptional regulator|nr:GntR family transcriptional regulator [Accumulibacter sp.]
MISGKSAYDARLPLYQRLRDEIVEKITTGEWRHDQPIPTEAELTKTYGIAVGTVRKAVDVLVAEGLLKRVQGRGTFVRRPNFNGLLFRFFRYQTGESEGKIPEGRVLTRTLETPPQHVVSALGLSAKAKVIRLERLRLIDGHVVLSEEIWLPKNRFAALLKVAPNDFDDLLYPFYESRCGQVVASAREILTVESANAKVAQALDVEPGRPVVVIERLAFGFDRKPLEWRRSYGVADTFRYQIDIY